MTNQNTPIESERVLVYRRLTEKKDRMLEATIEIEDIRRKYLNQNQKDEDGSIESEIYKKIYTIIACLSELIGYTQGRGIDIYKALLNYAIFDRSSTNSRFSQQHAHPEETHGYHIAASKVIDALCVAVNSIIITWSFKRYPIVSIDKLESSIQLFKLPGS